MNAYSQGLSSNKSSSTLVVTAIFDSSRDWADSSFDYFGYSCFAGDASGDGFGGAAAAAGAEAASGSAAGAAAGAAAGSLGA